MLTITPEIITGKFSDYKRVYWADLDYGNRFALVTDYILCVISFITAAVLFKLMHMVHKKLGTKDLVISFMLFFLTLACLASWVFFSECIFWNVIQLTNVGAAKRALMWPGSLHHIYGTNFCAFKTFGFIPSMFLFCAVVLNINKWIYFKWRVVFLS